MFDPSNRIPTGWLNDVVKVTTLMGFRLTFETDPVPGKLLVFATQLFCPSNAMPSGKGPNKLVKVVTLPAGCVGSI